MAHLGEISGDDLDKIADSNCTEVNIEYIHMEK